jgi:diguanylate cyclase (GGDEF)-like protein/PAS domain S-box-containing protein
VPQTLAAIGFVALLALAVRQARATRANAAVAARADRQRSILLSVLHSLGEGVVVADEAGNLILFNNEAQRIVGPEFLNQEHSFELDSGFYRPDGTRIEDDEMPLPRALRGDATDAEMALVRRGRRTVRIATAGRPVRDRHGALLGGVVVFRDETDRHAADAVLRDREAQLAEAQRLARMGSWEEDLASGATTWSDEYYRVLGYEPGAVPASSGRFTSHVHPDDVANVDSARAAAVRNGGRFSYQARIKTSAGAERWLEVHGRVVPDASGTPRKITGMAQDVTARVDVEEAQRRQGMVDPLTELPNRTHLVAALADRLARRRPDEGVALLLMNIDHFKDVNDSLGHEMGDRVLVEVANRLRRASRSSDLVTRLSGDEFAVVVGDLQDDSAAGTMAGNLVHLLDKAVEVNGATVQLTASIGIAYAPSHGDDEGTMLQKAEVAMRRAKQQSLGWTIYGPGDDHDRGAKLALLADLKDALDREDITVHYQPQVDLVTGRTLVVEALARWQHPEHGMVPPDQFVALAEQSGLIRKLTNVVLRQALGQCGKWRAEGIEVGIAVNLSPRSLVDPDLASLVHTALREADLPASVLTLEITESGFAGSTTELIRTLEDVRDLGVRLCIDDFGTGYSSLAYLKRLPVDEIKIDRAFVFDLESDSRDIAIVRSIIEMAHSLGLSVVAEGVESEMAGRLLTELRCDVAQGYGLCRPAPATHITGWLASRAGDPETAPYGRSSRSMA